MQQRRRLCLEFHRSADRRFNNLPNIWIYLDGVDVGRLMDNDSIFTWDKRHPQLSNSRQGTYCLFTFHRGYCWFVTSIFIKLLEVNLAETHLP
ncbi:hypothetical protein MAR_008004 [Mya arenaria]|uniref:Uncharacterized protein n=1 Tax=Mya arenaria TaxID=6604 RepID=A0ABY7DXN4_MYAAR|nr:hypothetical protein MAR_008004 [Mya arenaria]